MNKWLGFPDIEICTNTSTGLSNFKIEAQKPWYNSPLEPGLYFFIDMVILILVKIGMFF